MGAATAFGMAAVQYGFYAATLPTYTGGLGPANSAGYVLPGDWKSALISLIDGGPFSHAVATDGSGRLWGATPVSDWDDAVVSQMASGRSPLTDRQILWRPGVLSEGATQLAVDVSKGIRYNGANFGGMNCACFTAQALRNSEIHVNSNSPNGQYYELMLRGN